MKFNTVKEARQAGAKVKVTHKRFPNAELALYINGRFERCGFGPLEKHIYRQAVRAMGGQTVVELIYNDQHVVGEANCSEKDHYCKKTGVALALTRACAKLTDTYGIRND